MGEQGGEANQKIERLQKEQTSVQKYKKKTYENYVDGVLDKEEYLSYKAEYEKQDKEIRAKIQLAEQEKDSFGEAEESYENWIEKFIKYGTLSEVTREIVTELIEKIEIRALTSYLSISHLILKRKMQCKDCKFFYNNFPLVIMNT